jgi:CubicO group peptidase (beta-lactamase class C family)
MRRAALLVVLGLACSGETRPQQASDVSIPMAEPETAGFIADSLEALDDFVNAKIADGAFPGGVLAVGRGRSVVHLRAYGVMDRSDAQPVQLSTIYDLASLTKVVGLTTAVMFLVADGTLDIERPVVDIVAEFGGAGRNTVLVRNLLTHTSGLPAWVPLYEETPDADSALRRIYGEPLESEPGTAYVYSDLGAILLAQVVERLSGRPLDEFLEERLFAPLEMHDTGFRPDPGLLERIAPTEQDPWRGRMVRGEVHDENAYHLGGVSGHAGLFSTAPDLIRFVTWMLDSYHDRMDSASVPYLPSRLVQEFVSVQPGPQGSTRALGWDTPTPGGGASSGHLLSSHSFGHTGFTGTSIWVDTDREVFIILLTNRVHPTRDNRALLTIRGQVADKVMEALVERDGPGV